MIKIKSTSILQQQDSSTLQKLEDAYYNEYKRVRTIKQFVLMKENEE